MNKFIQRFVLILIILLLLIIPVFIFVALSLPDVSKKLTDIFKLENGELISFITDYLSLSVTLFLGVIVFFQSQKINKLEATQYYTYVGVINTDYTSAIENVLSFDYYQKDFTLSHLFNEDNRTIITSFIFDKKRLQKDVVIPLKFVTKNNPLIVSMNFRKIKISLKKKETKIKEKKLNINNCKICALLSDNSSFVWYFGLSTPNLDFDEIDIELYTILKDQNNNKQKLKTTVYLNRNDNDHKYYLTFSETIKKRGMDLV